MLLRLFERIFGSPPKAVILDVHHCLTASRIRPRVLRYNTSNGPYKLYGVDHMLVDRPEPPIDEHLRLLERKQFVEAIRSLVDSWVELDRLVPGYVKISHLQGSWGRGSHLSPKPGHIALDFLLNSRRFSIERYAGDAELDENERPGYGYLEFQVFVDGVLLFRGRQYASRPGPFQDSVGILESHLDTQTLEEVLSVASLNNYRVNTNLAKSKREHRHKRKQEKAADEVRLQNAQEAQRAAFEVYRGDRRR